MENIKLYQVSPDYVNYLEPYEPGLFHNKQIGQQHERAYIGIVLFIHNMNYFAPLSSFKAKHYKMAESLDFIKVNQYAVINLNNMFPVPDSCCSYIDISKEQDPKYRSLLYAEYRCIKPMQNKIRKNALTLYQLKISGKSSALTNRCNDFLLLESLCGKYNKK